MVSWRSSSAAPFLSLPSAASISSALATSPAPRISVPRLPPCFPKTSARTISPPSPNEPVRSTPLWHLDHGITALHPEALLRSWRHDATAPRRQDLVVGCGCSKRQERIESGPSRTRTGMSLARRRILNPLRLPFRQGAFDSILYFS